MKKKIGVFLLVVAIMASLGMLPTASVGANAALPSVVWLPPISNQGEFQLKDGSTLPIKFTLTDPVTGAFVEDTSLSVDVNQVLFCDDFNVGNFEGWTEVEGDETWVVSDGKLRTDGSIPQTRILADATSDYDDYIFEADAHLISGRGYALIFRAADYQSFYAFQYQAGTGALSLRLYQFTDFPTGADVAPLVNYTTDYEWHQLKVAVLGDNIKCYVDGQLVFDVDDTVDPALLSGRIGFRTWSGAQAEFDNVIVTALPEEKHFSYGTGSDNVRISYVFSNDFSSYTLGSDGSPTWTPVAGDWSIESDTQADDSIGQVYSQNDVAGTPPPRWSLAGDASWTDYVVEAKVKGIEGYYPNYDTHTWAGLVFRAQDNTHFYEYYFRTTVPDIIVVKNDGGIRTVVSGPVPFACQNGVWYTLKVIAEGNSFRFYVNDVEITGLAFSDPSFVSGKVGVYVWDGSHAHFDDVKVQVSPHYIANLHTKENGMSPGDYLITVWSGDNQLGTYLFDLTDDIQGKGRGKGKA